MKEVAWIIGHGLLGSAVASYLRTHRPNIELFMAPPFTWIDPVAQQQQFTAAIHTFGEHTKHSEGSYRIFWTAGRGIMSSTEEDMRQETANLAAFLRTLNTEERLKNVPGILCFSSSAGAVYAGSKDDVISETAAVAPTTAYGRGKLQQEELMKACSHARRGIFIARISNIYGSGQSRTKKQGLLTHIARCMLIRRPIHIYVPFDTIRDYVHVRDAAAEIVRTSECVLPGETVTKIIASQEPATIATIIALFKRITHQTPLVVTGTTKLGAVYPHRMRFASQVLPEVRGDGRIGLQEGIAETLAHERLAYAAGGMPA